MKKKKDKPQIFICYAKKDRQSASELNELLTIAGAKPWIDFLDLLPGDDWEKEIKVAVANSDGFVVCLSKGFNEVGFRQTEIRWALKALDKRPPGKGFIIPYVLEPCEIPAWCENIHVSDPSTPTAPEDLIRAVNKHCKVQLDFEIAAPTTSGFRNREPPFPSLSDELTILLTSNDLKGIEKYYQGSPLDRKVKLQETVLTSLSAWRSEIDEKGGDLKKLLMLWDRNNMFMREGIPILIHLVKHGLLGHPQEVELRRLCLRILSKIGNTGTVAGLFNDLLHDPDYTDIALRFLTRRRSSNFVWAFPISIKAMNGIPRKTPLKRAVKLIFREDLASGSARFKVIEEVLRKSDNVSIKEMLYCLVDWLGLQLQFLHDGDIAILFPRSSVRHVDLYTVGRLSSSILT